MMFWGTLTLTKLKTTAILNIIVVATPAQLKVVSTLSPLIGNSDRAMWNKT